jgi:hypothetical protein
LQRALKKIIFETAENDPSVKLFTGQERAALPDEDADWVKKTMAPLTRRLKGHLSFIPNRAQRASSHQ